MQANFIKKRKKKKRKAKVNKSIWKNAVTLEVDKLKKILNQKHKRRKSYEKFDIFICFLIYFAAQIGRNI